MEELELGLRETRPPRWIQKPITGKGDWWRWACGKDTIPLTGVLNEAGDPVSRTNLGQGEGVVGK